MFFLHLVYGVTVTIPCNQNATTVHQMTLFWERNVKRFYGEVPVHPLAEREDLSPHLTALWPLATCLDQFLSHCQVAGNPRFRIPDGSMICWHRQQLVA